MLYYKEGHSLGYLKMQKDFIVIAITRTDFYSGEACAINNLMEYGKIDFLHIRKPDSTKLEMEKLLKEIDCRFYHRIKLHDHFVLASKFNLGGININGRNRIPDEKYNSISKSLHSLDELENISEYDYVLLSPIFDSISKEGYKGKFDLDEIKSKIKGKKVIALGGITPEKFPILKEAGFVGGAMLGYFFPKEQN